MTTPSGVVAPVVPGTIIQPDAVLDPVSVPAHAFFSMLRNVVKQLPGVFKNEADLHAALDAIDGYENRVVPYQDRQYTVTESDHAGREDVSQRIPPQVGGGIPAVAGPQIDYARLAQALITAQKEAEAAAAVPPVQMVPNPNVPGGNQ
jgi:hypothetical protein